MFNIFGSESIMGPYLWNDGFTKGSCSIPSQMNRIMAIAWPLHVFLIFLIFRCRKFFAVAASMLIQKLRSLVSYPWDLLGKGIWNGVWNEMAHGFGPSNCPVYNPSIQTTTPSQQGCRHTVSPHCAAAEATEDSSAANNAARCMSTE